MATNNGWPGTDNSGAIDSHAILRVAIDRLAAEREFSPRELQVCSLVATGTRSKEIAHSLGVSPSTIGVIRGRMLKKAGCESTAELFAVLAGVRLERGGG